MSITLSSVSAFAVAVAAAHSVDMSSYTLRAGSVRDALLSAAQSGARVRIRLEGDPLDDSAQHLHAANRDTVAQLEAAGADAALTAAGSPTLHMKAAVVDGVAWLDDRNWAGDGRETVIRDPDADDVAAIGAALAGDSGGDGHLGTTKSRAQFLEVDVVRAAGLAPLAVESESFGSGAIYDALLARGRAGLPTRLIVAGRELAASGPAALTEQRRLAKLESLGVEVRTGDAAGVDLDEKLAVGAHAAWTGSANATYARGVAGEQRDWGLATREPLLVDGLRAAFEANWRIADPFRSPNGPADRANRPKAQDLSPGG